jgi:peptidoglycan hydrolase-like protein with peptidoglycan-binding domain
VVQRQADSSQTLPAASSGGGSPASCEEAPPQPRGGPPALDRWVENETLNRIRGEAPGENRTLLSRSRGSRGEAVELVQQAVLAFGCEERDANLLPGFGADGIFGSETDRAVRAFQEGRTVVDGIVGPLTLGELDEFVIPPAETRRGDEGGDGEAKKAPPSKSIRTDALKARIQSVDLTLPKGIRPVRLPAKNDKVQQTLDQPFEAAATVKLSPGKDLAGVRFGFFSLGRPFELWRVIYRRLGAGANESGAELNRDETFPLRDQLPALDHVSTFYPLPDGKQPAAVSGTETEVKVEFRDRPGNVFDEAIEVQKVFFGLNGIFVQSFFFTALGLVTPGGQALLLKTFYWTVRYCEAIGGNLSKAVTGSPIGISGPFDCLQGDCRENEPGADKFGSSGGKTFGAIVKETLPTYGDGDANKPPAGPDDFTLPCEK